MGPKMRAFRARGGAWVTLTLMLVPLASAAGEVTPWDPNGQPGPGEPLDVPLPVPVYSVVTDKAVYHPGDVVQIVHRIENLGEGDFVLESPAFHLWVQNGTGVAWSVPDEQAIGYIGILVLAPQQSLDLPYRWNMDGRDGEQVPAGEYEVVGVVNTDRIASATITILPEPGTFVLLLGGVAVLAHRGTGGHPLQPWFCRGEPA